MNCVWVHDAERRNYILTERNYQRLCNKGMIVLPKGKAVLVTKDQKVIFIEKNVKYPAEVQAVFDRSRGLRLKDVQSEIAGIHKRNNALYLERLVTDRKGRVDDVWKMVLSYLDPSSVVCLFLAASYFQKWLKPDFKNFSLNCVRDGHYNVFHWSKFPLPKQRAKLCEEAAGKGRGELLHALHRDGYPLGQSFYEAMINGHDNLIMNFPSKESIFSQSLFEHYARKGDVKMFSWCAHNFKLMGPFIAFIAAKGGSIEILKIIHEKGFLNRGNVYEGAIGGGHIHVLEWLLSIKYPKCHYAIRYAEKEKRPDVVEWLRKNDFS